MVLGAVEYVGRARDCRGHIIKLRRRGKDEKCYSPFSLPKVLSLPCGSEPVGCSCMKVSCRDKPFPLSSSCPHPVHLHTHPTTVMPFSHDRNFYGGETFGKVRGLNKFLPSQRCVRSVCTRACQRKGCWEVGEANEEKLG